MSEPKPAYDGTAEQAQESPIDTTLITKYDMTESVVALIREVQFDGAKEVVRKIIAVRDTYTEVAKTKRHDANVADAIVSTQTARLNALANGDTSVLKLRDQVYCPQCHTNYSEFTCDVCPTCGRDNKQK